MKSNFWWLISFVNTNLALTFLEKSYIWFNAWEIKSIILYKMIFDTTHWCEREITEWLTWMVRSPLITFEKSLQSSHLFSLHTRKYRKLERVVLYPYYCVYYYNDSFLKTKRYNLTPDIVGFSLLATIVVARKTFRCTYVVEATTTLKLM